MGQDDTDPAGADIEGTRVDDAVERVLSEENSYDPETVRTVLNTVAEDGVVTWDGVRSALGDAATVVSTPETRVELAERELAEAREAASDVDDLDVVAARFDEFESRLETVSKQVDGLGSRLESVTQRAEAETDLFAVAADLRRLESAANETQRTADELKRDIEAFERWLSDASAPYDELLGDVDALEESFDELEETVDALSRAVSGDDGGDELGGIEDVGVLWFMSVLQHRTLGFMIEDIRAELAGVRALAERETGTGTGTGNSDDGRPDGISNRLDDLEDREDAVGAELDDLATAEWIERFAGDIAAFNRELDALDQPADWSEVERLLEEYRMTPE